MSMNKNDSIDDVNIRTNVKATRKPLEARMASFQYKV